MTLTTAPDYVTDVLSLLAASTDIATRTGALNIARGVDVLGDTLPADAIVVTPVGGFGSDDTPFWRPRFQFDCYGRGVSLEQQRIYAFSLWQLLDAYLLAPFRDHRTTVAQGTTTFLSFARESAPLPITEPGTNRHRVVGIYRALVTRVGQ
jgi:hypothetical protein